MPVLFDHKFYLGVECLFVRITVKAGYGSLNYHGRSDTIASGGQVSLNLRYHVKLPHRPATIFFKYLCLQSLMRDIFSNYRLLLLVTNLSLNGKSGLNG